MMNVFLKKLQTGDDQIHKYEILPFNIELVHVLGDVSNSHDTRYVTCETLKQTKTQYHIFIIHLH